ncbi:MAG: non-homologous end-joining DNA ligase [Mycobacterium sp.]|nr:non-homologous end-joining DNA ligase [Mycobacterium sp.]
MPPAPMLATAGPAPSDTTGWCLEAKWDGARAAARCGQRIELFSRQATNLTEGFPEITDGLMRLLDGRPVILDGELVVLDEHARPSFALLQRRLRASRPPAHLLVTLKAMYFVFDCLWLDGEDVTGRPYLQRRELLAGLHLDSPPILTPSYWTGISADAMYDVVAAMGLEGYVLKRATSTYQPGRRSPHWVKVVVRQRAPLVVGGFTPGRGGFGALLVGAHNDTGELVYAGQVGTGLSQRVRGALAAQLAAIAQPVTPFAGPVPDDARISWVRPDVVVEVEYRQFTGRLRHAALKAVAAGVDATTVKLPPSAAPP